MIIDSRNWQIKLYKGHVPFVWFLLFVMCGILLSTWVTPDPQWFLALRILSGVCLLGCILCFWRPAYLGFVFFLFLASLSWVQAWKGHPMVNSKHFSRVLEAEGQSVVDPLQAGLVVIGYVEDEPRINERNARFRLEVIGIWIPETDTVKKMKGSIQVTAEKITRLNYGDLVAFPIDRVGPVQPPRNPGEMNYAAHLAKQNCWHQAYLGEGQLQMLGSGYGSGFIAYSLGLRKAMVDKFERFVPDPDAFAIASTLILGYRADLSAELMETFSATGTIHVLSVSGMHVVIVFWLLAKLLFWMDYRKPLKKLRFPLLLLAIWAYAILTGWSPSVLRAAMMLSFVLWAEAWSRRSRTYNNIAASAFFLLLFDPKLLLDIGFQLSYLAVAGIVFLYPLLHHIFRKVHRFAKPVVDYSLMSVSAQAGAFPLAMFYFQQFPVYFLLANLLIVLPASAIMYLGFALLFLPESTATHSILVLLGKGLSGLIVWMNESLAWIQSLPAASLTGLETSALQCILIYLLMLSLIFAFVHRSKRLFGSFLLITLLLVVLSVVPFYERWTQRKLIVHQARSALAISYTGRGESWVYSDLPGPDHSTFRFSLLPHLRTFVSPEQIKWIVEQEEFEDETTNISKGVLQIGNKRMYIYDHENWLERVRDRVPERGEGSPAQMEWPEPFAVDLLLIRKNPRKPLLEIAQQYPSRMIVMDGSNYPRTIERIKNEADSAGLAYYVLKDNFAYVWLLDE